jgi:hypothetical protein
MTNESKWASEFGTEYTKRNNPDIPARTKIFYELLDFLTPLDKVLEIGANKGHNLSAIELATGCSALGVEINKEAASQSSNPILIGSAYSLPFLNGKFELVFTAGVLIHLDNYIKAMQEIYRASRKYILSIEYFDKEPRKIQYRDGVLCQAMPWKDIWLENFKDLKVVKEGNMSDFKIDDGTDFSRSCEYLILEKL